MQFQIVSKLTNPDLYEDGVMQEVEAEGRNLEDERCEEVPKNRKKRNASTLEEEEVNISISNTSGNRRKKQKALILKSESDPMYPVLPHSSVIDCSLTAPPIPYPPPPSSTHSSFSLLVYSLTCSIPVGRVSTYGLFASYISMKQGKNGRGSAQAVGQALRKNPFAPRVPCHRVIASDLFIGGFKGCFGLATSCVTLYSLTASSLQRLGEVR
ncbi:hypothetical protein BT69DRAFT_1352397 [Atractiella rhizophila]|nr:hypothetical protein BT69DRAFT_1352397 [Atractiella rhizophila]